MEKAVTPAKDVMMPMTEAHFYRVIGMHDELIHEQRLEIGKLKHKINQLQQQLKKVTKHGST